MCQDQHSLPGTPPFPQTQPIINTGWSVTAPQNLSMCPDQSNRFLSIKKALLSLPSQIFCQQSLKNFLVVKIFYLTLYFTDIGRHWTISLSNTTWRWTGIRPLITSPSSRGTERGPVQIWICPATISPAVLWRSDHW